MNVEEKFKQIVTDAKKLVLPRKEKEGLRLFLINFMTQHPVSLVVISRHKQRIPIEK